jgi:hypothetical protein
MSRKWSEPASGPDWSLAPHLNLTDSCLLLLPQDQRLTLGVLHVHRRISVLRAAFRQCDHLSGWMETNAWSLDRSFQVYRCSASSDLLQWTRGREAGRLMTIHPSHQQSGLYLCIRMVRSWRQPTILTGLPTASLTTEPREDTRSRWVPSILLSESHSLAVMEGVRDRTRSICA